MIVFASLTILAALYHGIPLGKIRTNIEVFDTGTIHVHNVGKGAMGFSAHTVTVKLSSGVFIELTSRRSEIKSGEIVLNKRFSPIRMNYVYSIEERDD